MGIPSTGGCLCGASTYHFDAEVKFAIRCYCRDCQQASGGGHMPQVAIPLATFTSSGPIKGYAKTSEAGSALRFSFCGECGSPLFKSTSKMPDMLVINAGSLGQIPQIPVFQKVFEGSRQSWDID